MSEINNIGDEDSEGKRSSEKLNPSLHEVISNASSNCKKEDNESSKLVCYDNASVQQICNENSKHNDCNCKINPAEEDHNAN